MTTQELISELDTCLGAAAADQAAHRKGLSHLVKKFEAVRKDRRKKLKKTPCKARRKTLKSDLRLVEQVLQQVS